MAVAFIAHNPRPMESARSSIPSFPRGLPSTFKGGTLLSSIARKFETTVAKLHELNPALRADRVPPNQRTYAIRLPIEDDEAN